MITNQIDWVKHNQSKIQTFDLKLWTTIRELEIKFDVSHYKLTQKVNCLNRIELDSTKQETKSVVLNLWMTITASSTELLQNRK